MPRSVKEWIGKTDDEKVPPRVRERVFEKHDQRCHKCNRKIATGERWTLEHLIALINGGQNRESNLGVTCDWCLPEKNREDATVKKKNTKVRYAHHGIKTKKQGIRSRGFPKAEPQHTATRPIIKRSEAPK